MVWLQAVVVVCSYCGYKGIDYYSLYAANVLNMNEVTAANFVANASYIRVFAAICAGFLVDRFSATKVISFTFLLLLISYLFLALSSLTNHTINIIYSNLILTFVGVYGLRGVYFALLEETKIERLLTGTAVGLISVVGYTPDVFFNSIAGRILDASPGVVGFQHFFVLLAGFSIIGISATLIIQYTNKQKII